MKSDPLAISSAVFRYPRYATANHTICQKEKILEFRGSHFPSHAPAIIYLLPILRQHRRKSLYGRGGFIFSVEGTSSDTEEPYE